LVKPGFRPERFVPLLAGKRRIGWLRPELAARLGCFEEVFACSADRVSLRKPEGLDPVVEQLAREGFIPGWRNERYRIEDLFEIERAAARPFGFTTQAVHLNGIVGGRMWLARRSATKPIDPGLLDNLVGGGVSAGFSIEETLRKEAWEEAGIPEQLVARATRAGTVRVLREVPEGNLSLPEAFTPRNQDGEVQEFRLASFDEVRACEDMTHEAKLVALDYLRS
jgi:8-oxo-dGTP pyrophosphatase MutT (NUDIX family)